MHVRCSAISAQPRFHEPVQERVEAKEEVKKAEGIFDTISKWLKKKEVSKAFPGAGAPLLEQTKKDNTDQ